MIPKRKPKVGNNRKITEGETVAQVDFKRPPGCTDLQYHLPLKKNGFIEDNHFHLYSRYENILHTLFFSVIYGYKLFKKRDDLQHNLFPSLLMRWENDRETRLSMHSMENGLEVVFCANSPFSFPTAWGHPHDTRGPAQLKPALSPERLQQAHVDQVKGQ